MEDGDDAGVTVRGGEEDPRPLETAPRYCPAVMDGSIVGAAPLRCTATRLKHDKTDKVNLKWDPNIICNR